MMKQSNSIIPQLKALMEADRNVRLCILFGSVARQKEDFNSDIDVAVAGQSAMEAPKKQELIEQLATVSGRPVDLIDLQLTSGTLLHQILTKGRLVYCDDHTLYANIIKRMLFNQADMMPYHNRILKERRERWING